LAILSFLFSPLATLNLAADAGALPTGSYLEAPYDPP